MQLRILGAQHPHIQTQLSFLYHKGMRLEGCWGGEGGGGVCVCVGAITQHNILQLLCAEDELYRELQKSMLARSPH